MSIHREITLATDYIKRGQLSEACSLLQSTVEQEPGNSQACILLAQCLTLTNQPHAAINQLSTLISPTNIASINSVAEVAYKLGLQLDFVLSAYEKFINSYPSSNSAAYNFAYYTSKNAQAGLAIERYKSALDKNIDRPEEIHLNIAKIYSEELAEIELAKMHLETALRLKPEYSAALFNLANLEEQLGERKAAIDLFNRCLTEDPNNPLILARLLDLKPIIDEQNELLLRAIQLANDNQDIDLNYAIGRAFESVGNAKLAWQYYSTANSARSKSIRPYNRTGVEKSIGYLKNICTNDWLRSSAASNTAEPIFITGMFRSGTTLLEQILASHGTIAASGERSFIPQSIRHRFNRPGELEKAITSSELDELANKYIAQSLDRFGQVDFVIDKRPDNFLHIGLLHRLFPQAKFIVLIRDWRDVALSIYSHHFGANQNYANSISDIKHYYESHLGIIDHWQKLLPNAIKILNYESMVKEPKSILQPLVRWLDLPWEDKLLEFYQRKSVVQTPSVWQVRQPINQSAIGRWQKFKDYVPEFID